MSEENDRDLEKTEELFALLQGTVPDDCKFPRGHVPKLTADQAWTVIWWLGNQYWQVTDRVERCDMCRSLYHTWQEGDYLGFGRKPYNFCGDCLSTPTYSKKLHSRANPERPKQ